MLVEPPFHGYSHVGVEAERCILEYKGASSPLIRIQNFCLLFLSTLAQHQDLVRSFLIFITMEHQTPEERAQVLVTALEEHGQGDYIGESINQLEHSLQAADQARKSGKVFLRLGCLYSILYLTTEYRGSR